MKFGVLQFFSWPERRTPLEAVYERAVQRAEVMDRTGYDAVWLAEHHFAAFSVCPSVNLMGMHLANRTTRLRIGTAVSLAAFYHPLRLAEEVALLDVLSGGRVNWGAGRGFDRTEFDAFGVTPDDSYPRFRENVEIVLAAWNNERLTHHGRFHHFDDVEVLPKPRQRPHPPVWMAAGSPEAIVWAAEAGHSIMMDPHSPYDEIARKHALYRRTLEANGHEHAGRDIPMARLVAIADTDAEAADVARRGVSWIMGSYFTNDKNVTRDIRSPERQAEAAPAPEGDPVERYLRNTAVHGSPERVIDQLLALQDEMALSYLLAAPLSHRSFELLTERVLPKLL
ncbi:MAG: LLM class flavin-dependent oxidoreductase [Acidimicrobiales bacterium]